MAAIPVISNRILHGIPDFLRQKIGERALLCRVASREQVQVEVSFPRHRMWLDLFLGWWEYGMRSWSQRAGANDELSFVCELGPRSPMRSPGRTGTICRTAGATR